MIPDSKSLSFNQTNNMHLFRQQQNYYAQGASLASHMDNQGIRKGAVGNPGGLVANGIGHEAKSASQKPGRDPIRANFSGRDSSQQHYTSAPQKV